MPDPQDRRPGIGGLGEGIRTGLGILNAFKEAVEETLQDSVDRGDLSADRARQTLREFMQRAQGGLDEARLRLDWVPRQEFEELRAELAALQARVAALEDRAAEPEPEAPVGLILPPE